MSLNNTAFNTIKTSKSQVIPFDSKHLPHYTLCAGLGGLSGAIGVAVVIGTVLIYQLFFTEASELVLGFAPLMILAALVSCGVAWLSAYIGRLLIRSLAHNFNEQSWQIVFVFSILACLIEFPLFMHGL